MIKGIEFRGDGVPSSAFIAGQCVSMRLSIQAEEDGPFRMTPTAVIYRMDGVLVTRYIGAEVVLSTTRDQILVVELELGTMRFGNGQYVVTVAIYRSLDVTGSTPSPFYDLLDRSFTFAVSGHPPLIDGVVVESRPWRVLTTTAGTQASQKEGVEKQVKALSGSYTNAIKLKEKMDVLQSQLDLKYAALNAFKVISENLPEGLFLTSFTFSKGKTVLLTGSAPVDQTEVLTKFAKDLRDAAVEEHKVFSSVPIPKWTLSPGAGGSQQIRWDVTCDLKRTDTE